MSSSEQQYSQINPPARTRRPAVSAETLPVFSAQSPKSGARSGPNWDENGDYIVGKWKPPVAHTWVKGQSGNPRGLKPKKPKSPNEEIVEALTDKRSVKIGDQLIEMDAAILAITVLREQTAKKDRQAALAILNLYKTYVIEPAVDARAAEQPAIDPAEMAAIEQLLTDLGLPDKPVIRRANSDDEETR